MPLYGAGINTRFKDLLYLGQGIAPNSNSVGVLGSAITFGLPYMICYLFLAAKNIFRFQKNNRIVLIIMLILMGSAEAIFEYPIMYMLLFRFCPDRSTLVEAGQRQPLTSKD